MKLRWPELAAILAASSSLLACQETRGPLVVPELRFDLTAHWVDQSDYPGVGAGRILITNNGEDTVSILDLAQVGQPGFGELLRKPVGLIPAHLEGPHHMALDPAGEFYYVGISNFVLGGGAGPHGAHGSGTADGWLLKFRAADNDFLGQVRVDRNPGDLVTSRDGKTVYVTHFDLLRITEVAARGGTTEEMRARLAIIDAETLTRRAMVPICAAPHGVTTSFDGRRVYVACYSDEIAVIQVDDPQYPVTRVKVASNAGDATSARHEPFAINVSPTTGEVWVSSLRSGEVQVLDPVSLTITRSIRVGGGPVFGTFSRDGSRFYVPHQVDDRVSVIRTDTGEILQRISVPSESCRNVHWIELTPDERYGLLLCEGDHIGPGTLLVLDMEQAGAVIQTVPVGVFPDFVGILRRPQP